MQICHSAAAIGVVLTGLSLFWTPGNVREFG